jgi:hypothetical protein
MADMRSEVNAPRYVNSLLTGGALPFVRYLMLGSGGHTSYYSIIRTYEGSVNPVSKTTPASICNVLPRLN